MLITTFNRGFSYEKILRIVTWGKKMVNNKDIAMKKTGLEDAVR